MVRVKDLFKGTDKQIDGRKKRVVYSVFSFSFSKVSL